MCPAVLYLNTLDSQIRQAIEILRRGGIVAYPTDTVYGLGADYLNEDAVAKVYEVKGRAHRQPISLLLSSVSQISTVALDIPGITWVLAERFLPGGLTLVLLKSPLVPDLLTGGSGKIAVRVPAHPVPIALIEGIGAPITGTSANLSGSPSPVTADEVRQQLGDRVDLIINGGRCPGGVDSTVIDLTTSIPRIVREGAIGRGEIERACGMKVQ